MAQNAKALRKGGLLVASGSQVLLDPGSLGFVGFLVFSRVAGEGRFPERIARAGRGNHHGVSFSHDVVLGLVMALYWISWKKASGLFLRQHRRRVLQK